eukprot:1987663-Prymnesium_polylepis.1
MSPWPGRKSLLEERQHKYAGGFHVKPYHDELDRVRQGLKKAIAELLKGRAAWQRGERSLVRAELDPEHPAHGTRAAAGLARIVEALGIQRRISSCSRQSHGSQTT